MLKLKKNNIFIKCIVIMLGCLTPFISDASPVENCEQLIKSSIQSAENKDFISSFEQLNKAKIIAEENNLYQQQFWILTNLGINYAEMLDYSEALENFLDAYKLAIKHLDTRSEMSILNNIAGLYYLDKKYSKAEENYLQVYNYARDINDSTLTGGAALNLALIANDTGQEDLAENYLNIAERYFVSHKRGIQRSAAYRINVYIKRKEYKKAEELALQILPQLDNIEQHDLKISVLFYLVKIYTEQGAYDDALRYLSVLSGEDINIENKINVFEYLSSIYASKQNYQLALNYKDSVLVGLDSVQRIRDNKHFENNRIKFELLKNEQELIESRLRLKNERIVFIFLILISIVLIWGIIVNFIREKQRKKIIELELEQEKNNKLLLEKQYKEQETESLLEKERLMNEQERLKNEIEKKNRELASKALSLSNRNEVIEHIIASLSEMPEVKKNKDILQNVQQLRKQLKNTNELDSFISHFENINHQFLQNLHEKHPNLTANEIRFLSYIYINLNSKEISSLLNITPEYCKKKKQQISHKLGLESTTLLYGYLSELG